MRHLDAATNTSKYSGLSHGVNEKTNDERTKFLKQLLSIYKGLRLESKGSAFRLTGETGEFDLDLERDLQQDQKTTMLSMASKSNYLTISHLVSGA